MATGNGYGRGGRGAALLQLLNNPVRRPGDQGDQRAEAPAQPSPADVQPGPKPTGGGDFLPPASKAPVVAAASQAPVKTPSPEPVVVPVQVPVPRPSGRGALLQQLFSQMQQPPTEQPVGAAAAVATSEITSPPVSEPVSSGASKALGRAALLGQHVIPPGQDSSATQPSGLQSMGQLSAALPAKPVASVSKAEMVAEAGEPSEKTPPPPSGLQRILDRLDNQRPAIVRKGTVGEKVSFSANYIALRCVNAGVYQYAVSFRPEVDSRGMRTKMLNEHKNVIGETKAFDGSILFLPIQLPEKDTFVKSVRPSDGQEVMIKMQFVKVLPPASCLQLYNVIFRRVMSILKMCQVGRNYFLPSGAVPVPQHKLEIWPGYVTAIAEYEGGVMLLTDVSHRVLRTETVLDVISNIVRNNPRGFQDDINKKLIGCMVLTRYNNKTYRIDDIAWDKNPLSTFQSMTGDSVSFVDYFRNSYNKVVRDLQQPLLVHIPKKRDVARSGQKGKRGLEVICLVPELCFMTGLTDEIRQDFRVMKDLAAHTRITPAQRRNSLRSFCQNVKSIPEAKAELMKWGLELDTDIMELEGRLLPQEKIVLKNRQVDAGFEADWSRTLTREHVLTAVDLTNWMVVTTDRDAGRTLDFVNMYMQCARDMGIRVERPSVYQLPNDRTETYLREIRAKMSDRVQAVVTIFPTSRDDRYNAIKKLCCVECPVPSQCINSKTISQPNKLRSVTQKIALQVNCKLGGELWEVKIPTKGLMVCGIDTYHDAGQRKNSVAGFVSSINAKCTRWYSRVCCQTPGEELVNGLQLCFTAALRKYHEVNHKLPDRIIIYRDGVGDGQLNTVASYEVTQLMECFKHFGPDYHPNLAVVVVQKRINTRILARKGQGPNSMLDNPPPGSILDHTITRKEWFDFFLVSQHVRQGTVSPTHYVVVHDTSNWDVDKLQCLAYKMTHLYYNWPGTVRVPAPCQYAHKLAYLVGQNIRKEPSHLLADRLFFL